MRSLPLILFLTAPALASADVSLEFSDGSHVLVSGNEVVFGDDEGYSVFEVGQESFVMVNNEDRTYMEISEDFLEQLGAATTAQMEQMLGDLPPEEREMYRQSMQSGAGGPSQLPETTVRKTGKTGEVAGFDCSEVEIVDEAGDVEEVICAATAGELGVSDQEYAAMMAATRAMSRMVGFGEESLGALDFEAIGGIPIRTQDAMDNNDAELVSVSKDRIDAARFEVPAGYRRTTIEEMMGGEP